MGQEQHVVYLGAGLASDLDRYLALDPAQIHLIEPNPELAEDLAALREAHPEVVHVIPQGVTVNGGLQKLNVYSFFDISSFARPEALATYYPGATVTATPRVQTMTPAMLMDQLGLPETEAHTLVIDTPGLTFDILTAFADAGLLERFMHLHVHVPRQPLFAEHQEPDTYDALLTAADFVSCADNTQENITASDDPDWHMSLYRRDRHASERRRLEAELGQAQTALHSSEAQVRALSQHLDQTQAILSEMKAQHHVQARTLEDTRKHQAALEAQCELLKTALNEARAAPIAPDDLTETEAIKALQNTLEKTRLQLEDAQQAQAMSMRTQALLQSNHLDLQTRYEALYREKEDQDTFLRSLLNLFEEDQPKAKDS